MFHKTFKKVYAYGKGKYLVNLDEDIENIVWAIKYKDHGDEYVLVKTKDDKLYIYGVWGHLIYEPSDKNLIRKETEFAKRDIGQEHLNINRLYRAFTKERGSFHQKELRKCMSTAYAQSIFNEFILGLYETYRNGYYYDYKTREDYILYATYKDVVIEFLKLNDIYTDDNIEAIKLAPWHSKMVKGCRGISGKRVYTNKYIYCDEILRIYVGGESYKDNKKCPYQLIPDSYDTDEWGIDEYAYRIQNIENTFSQMVLF